MAPEMFTFSAGTPSISSTQSTFEDLARWLGARNHALAELELMSLTEQERFTYCPVPGLMIPMARQANGMMVPDVGEAPVPEAVLKQLDQRNQENPEEKQDKKKGKKQKVKQEVEQEETPKVKQELKQEDVQDKKEAKNEKEPDIKDFKGFYLDTHHLIELLSLMNTEQGGSHLPLSTKKWLNSVLGFHWNMYASKYHLDNRTIATIFCHILDYGLLKQSAAFAYVKILRYLAAQDRSHVSRESNNMAFMFHIDILRIDRRKSEYNEFLEAVWPKIGVGKKGIIKPELTIEKVLADLASQQ